MPDHTMEIHMLKTCMWCAEIRDLPLNSMITINHAIVRISVTVTQLALSRKWEVTLIKGNNILTNKNVFKALHYGKSIQSVKVACISTNTSKATLSPYTQIPKISQYHSFEFHHDHMIMWRYFGIEEGKRWNYRNFSFMPNITVVLPFSSTTSSSLEGEAMSKKRTDDRTFFFFNWHSLHARLNSHYEAPSSEKRSTKKITEYRKSV